MNLSNKMAAQVSTSLSFSQFFGGKEPSECIYEDEQCIVYDEAMNDRQAPIHFLVVPKNSVPRLIDAKPDDEKIIGHLLLVARNIAVQKGSTGYHVMLDENPRMNKLKAIHVFERALHHMLWPMGPGHKL